MYGTVADLRIKSGKENEVLDLMRQWEQNRKPNIKGAIATYVYKLDEDPNRWALAVVFEDRESYRENAEDPGQDAWYRQFRELLEEDPVWKDGEIVYSS